MRKHILICVLVLLVTLFLIDATKSVGQYSKPILSYSSQRTISANQFSIGIKRDTLNYVEGKVRISPKQNVFYKTKPRDLNFTVHHPNTGLASITYNDKEVKYSSYDFTNFQVDDKPLQLPFTERIEIAKQFLAELPDGKHVLNFNFENGESRTFKLQVVDEKQDNEYKMEIVNFNVGHGDAVFISLPDKNILVDTGPNDMARKRVVPFLKKHGIERIDHIIITHWHWDHVSGLSHYDKGFDVNEFNPVRHNWFDPDNALKAFEVGKIWYNLTDGETTGLDGHFGDGIGSSEEESGKKHYPKFRVGNELEMDDAVFKILNAARYDKEKYPAYSTDNFGGYDGKNNRSLSFNLLFNGFVYSHGADVYQHTQQAILETFGQEIVRGHVYQGNHHFHGGVDSNYLKQVDPYLFITPGEAACYNRDAYVDQVMGDAVPYLETKSDRFIENLFDYETGHIVIRVNDSYDWRYETYYHNSSHVETPANELRIPGLFN